jgi:hypothetical protein
VKTKKKSTITSPAARRREKAAFEAEFDKVFRHLFEPGLANVLAAARIPPTYGEAYYQDDGDRFKAGFSAVHDLVLARPAAFSVSLPRRVPRTGSRRRLQHHSSLERQRSHHENPEWQTTQHEEAFPRRASGRASQADQAGGYRPGSRVRGARHAHSSHRVIAGPPWA